MTRLGAFLLGVMLLAGPALAAPLGVLVEERARSDYADSLPPEGEFEVTVKDAPKGEVVTLAEFWMDPRSGKFLANAVLETGDVQRIGGLALVTLPVPVPVRRLLPDDIIMEDDLAVARMPVGRVGAYVETELEEVIGKQVRRVLTPGRPIQTQSIINPLVISRGDQVEISFSDGLLALRSPGRALSDAHEGQEIRIVNLISNKTVIGIATGDGTVEILQ
ncbi:flagellar basal body P-ring formation chaperone FlgA [Sulfitobacter delicatus]|jgi:flagellar basal body P-ring formation protein FlgA|uniref:Flagella basal body P-ring formation protein FlgA n=1 Tax=Sulfitobacter delicatus TaxID=218672 RepID=A0A1G7UG47_9RHOB|nr:flagellar basal body P-ring formation chaperone FlgA [Sulfitobacter delicatus]SDG46576.1 flagella basal body P-ring formation protein FlgA [Sulfitobacter delicatus]